VLSEKTLTMQNLKIIATQVSESQGVPPLGRPFIRRKAGVVEWLKHHWGAVQDAVLSGAVTLQGQTRSDRPQEDATPPHASLDTPEFLLSVMGNLPSDWFDNEEEDPSPA
jgi:hypothetical protein